ncbi:TPA: SIS domain-containing protein [bacterium]|nr:SIS domain-containing protein [bacterium]
MNITIMESEIREEPEIVGKILNNNINVLLKIKSYLEKRYLDGIYISARGTSDNASNLGKYLIESMLGYTVALSAPSLFTIYKTPPSLKNRIVIGVSQSGRGEDVCEVIAQGKKDGALCIAITNDPDSPLAEMSDEVILCWAGEEKSVPATKTYLAEIFNLYLFCAILSDRTDILNLLKNDIPLYIKEVIDKSYGIDVTRFHFMDRCIVIGRGFNYPSAIEFSLKLKETSYIFSESFSSADFLHGPLVLVSPQMPIFIFMPSGPSYKHLKEVIGILEEKNTEVFSFSFERLKEERLNFVLPFKVDEVLSPLLFAPAFQIFANRLAVEKGINPDNPRYLKKVTITR